MTVTFGEQRTEQEKAYDEVVLARVKRGIAFAEKHYGPDWADHINMEQLDLRSGNACILGQLERHKNGGEYYSALDRFWENENTQTRMTAKLGFCTPAKDYRDEGWDELQAAWMDALTPRVISGQN